MSHDLIELPSLIGKLNFLIKMDLKLNHLTDLPTEFSKLGLLEQLNIAKNQFSTLPKVVAVVAEDGVVLVVATAFRDCLRLCVVY